MTLFAPIIVGRKCIALFALLHKSPIDKPVFWIIIAPIIFPYPDTSTPEVVSTYFIVVPPALAIASVHRFTVSL